MIRLAHVMCKSQYLSDVEQLADSSPRVVLSDLAGLADVTEGLRKV